jgi:uncharacterized repeat protein (TIGR01451 family)
MNVSLCSSSKYAAARRVLAGLCLAIAWAKAGAVDYTLSAQTLSINGVTCTYAFTDSVHTYTCGSGNVWLAASDKIIVGAGSSPAKMIFNGGLGATTTGHRNANIGINESGSPDDLTLEVPASQSIWFDQNSVVHAHLIGTGNGASTTGKIIFPANSNVTLVGNITTTAGTAGTYGRVRIYGPDTITGNISTTTGNIVLAETDAVTINGDVSSTSGELNVGRGRRVTITGDATVNGFEGGASVTALSDNTKYFQLDGRLNVTGSSTFYVPGSSKIGKGVITPANVYVATGSTIGAGDDGYALRSTDGLLYIRNYDRSSGRTQPMLINGNVEARSYIDEFDSWNIVINGSVTSRDSYTLLSGIINGNVKAGTHVDLELDNDEAVRDSDITRVTGNVEAGGYFIIYSGAAINGNLKRGAGSTLTAYLHSNTHITGCVYSPSNRTVTNGGSVTNVRIDGGVCCGDGCSSNPGTCLSTALTGKFGSAYCAPNLNLTKTVNDETDITVNANQTVTFKLNIWNPTGSAVNNITVKDALPSGLECISYTDATGALRSCAGQSQVIWNLNSPDGTTDLYLTAKAKCTATNTARLSYGSVIAESNPAIVTVEGGDCDAFFDAVEPGAMPQGRIYTKLAGVPFSLDVLALDAMTALNTTYQGAVQVDLVDVSTGDCPLTGAGMTEVQSITLAASDQGRKSVSFTSNNAARNVRVRIQAPGGSLPPVCSSDSFAIRPASFSSVYSNTANGDPSAGTNATATATRTGSAFNILANTGVSGYDGLPKANLALIEWPAAPAGGRAAPGVGTLTGSFTNPASIVDGNGASGSFTYDEVGYFRFQTHAVYDDDFVEISGDKAADDCIVGSFSNVLSGGKYGCNFGNEPTHTSHIGRFIADHFETRVTPACEAGVFSYAGQPFPVTVTAKNTAGNTTQNYSGTFARNTTLTARNTLDTQDNPGPGTLTLPAGSVASASFSGGIATPSPGYAFTTQETAPTGVRIRASDGEISSLRSPEPSIEGSTTIRSGRALMHNAYGPEQIDLRVTLRAEYYDGVGWRLNAQDSCTGDTSLGADNAVTLTLTPGTLTCVLDAGDPGASGVGCATPAPTDKRFARGTTPTPGFAGDFNLWLRAPGANHSGSVTIEAVMPPWLGNVSSRATFGRYKSPVIYLREVY